MKPNTVQKMHTDMQSFYIDDNKNNSNNSSCKNSNDDDHKL